MSNGDLHWIANYIWGIADDVSETSTCAAKVPGHHLADDGAAPAGCGSGRQQAGGARHEGAAGRGLRQAAGQAFYNTSTFTLRDLRARASRQQFRADFEAYLDGFSPNVQHRSGMLTFNVLDVEVATPRGGVSARRASVPAWSSETTNCTVACRRTTGRRVDAHRGSGGHRRSEAVWARAERVDIGDTPKRFLKCFEESRERPA